MGLGIQKENMFWLDIKNIQTAGDINSYDVMYVCGGNTFYLLNEVRNTGFDKKIIDFVNNGGLYVGVSAGSIIMGPNISTAKNYDKNFINLKDLSGFNLTSESIVPHYTESEKEITDKFELENNRKVVRLQDSQTLEVLDGICKIIE